MGESQDMRGPCSRKPGSLSRCLEPSPRQARKVRVQPLGHWRACDGLGLAAGPATASPGAGTLRPEQVTEQPAFGQILAEAPGGHAARGGRVFFT